MAIFIHIGLNKTGSSSIQKFCDVNRDLLQKHNLVYPGTGIHDSAHYGISKMLIDKPDNGNVAIAEGLENTISAAINSGKDVLISSEYFFQASDPQVAGIKDYFTQFNTAPKIIIYLRRHDLWIASLFNQAMKSSPGLHPWQSDIRNYFISLLGSNEFQLRYSVILDKWAAHFGAENLIVRPFEAGQFKSGDYVWDFLGSAKATLPDILQKSGLQSIRSNESIPDELVRIISHVRASSLDLESKNVITSVVLKSAANTAGAKHKQPWDSRISELPLFLRKSIVKFFADDYAYIAKKYLQSDDGILFRDAVK